MGRRPEVEYDPDVHIPRLLEMQEAGLTDVEIYASFDIKKPTFYRWLREHEDFADAYDRGSPKCEAVYIKKARECWERGDDKGFKYFISLMNNKFGWESGGKESKTNIQINQQINNVIENKSSPQLIQDILRQLENNKNIIDIKTIDTDEPTASSD